MLIDEGADIKARDSDNMTPLHSALFKNAPYDIIELLINKGADIKARDSDNQTTLHSAIEFKSPLNVIELLINNGADINAKGIYNQTSLHSVLRLKYPTEVIELLLSKGAELNAEDKMKRTPLMYALMTKYSLTVIDLLLKRGANSNAKDKNYNTPLYYAIYNELPIETIELLIRYNAEINFENINGETPLYPAFYFCSTEEWLSLLLESKAKPEIHFFNHLLTPRSSFFIFGSILQMDVEERIDLGNSFMKMMKHQFQNYSMQEIKKKMGKNWGENLVEYYHVPNLSFLTFFNKRVFTFELVSIYQIATYSNVEIEDLFEAGEIEHEIILRNGKKINSKSYNTSMSKSEDLNVKKNKNGWNKSFKSYVKERNYNISASVPKDYYYFGNTFEYYFKK